MEQLADLLSKIGYQPYMQELLCALTLIIVDICALAIMMRASGERKRIESIWRKNAHNAWISDGKTKIPLTSDEILLGRHTSADVRFRDASCSRYHAMMTLSEGKWTITDLNSHSGLIVNGEKVSSRLLKPHDQIQIGNVVLEYMEDHGKEKE